LSAERRKALLDMMSSQAALAQIPALEMLTEGEEQSVQGGRTVLWPCSREELERAIDAALADTQA
jgi:hypothetical protein